MQPTHISRYPYLDFRMYLKPDSPTGIFCAMQNGSEVTGTQLIADIPLETCERPRTLDEARDLLPKLFDCEENEHHVIYRLYEGTLALDSIRQGRVMCAGGIVAELR